MKETENLTQPKTETEELVVQIPEANTNVNSNNSKMKNCKTCGKFIAKSAKKCPFCGAKNKKKFYKRKRFWVIIIFLLILLIEAIPKDEKNANQTEGTSSSVETTEQNLNYKDVYVGDTINTEFVSITIDEVSTTYTLYSENSSMVLNSEPGDIKVFVRGTITNTSTSAYDVGGMGSMSYSTKTYVDADLELTNGESEYGALFIDNGGTYGIISDGYLKPYDSVTYYIVFNMNENYYYSFNKGEITLAFTDDFAEEPSYNRDNCDYLYRINF